MGLNRGRANVAAIGITLLFSWLGLAACGQEQPQPEPLQSPIQTPPALPAATLDVTITPAAPLAPTATLEQVPTVLRQRATEALVPTADRNQPTQALVPTVVRSPIFLPSPVGGTPDTLATSQAVIATITALAAPPTYPPTATRSRPIGAAGRTRVTAVPTPTLDPSGISLLSMSERVFPAGAGALTVRTRPGATCLLQLGRAQSDGSLSKQLAPGGASREAGGDGVAAWIWQVDGAEAPGKLMLLVDCGSSGTAQYEIEVAR